MEVLKKVSKKEGITLPEELAWRIAAASDQNLRRAILSLEATKVKQYVGGVVHSLLTTPFKIPIPAQSKDRPGRLGALRAGHCKGNHR